MPLIEINGKRPIIHGSCYVAPNATIIGDVRIKADSSIWFNSVLRADQTAIDIGEETNIQDGVIIHPDKRMAVIGDRVTIGHGAILEGVYIEEEALIGIGAIILEGVKVGRHSLIGAGSLVPSGMFIPEGSLVMGIPAKIIGEVNAKHLKIINVGWRGYLEHKDAYKDLSKVIDI